MFLAPCSQVKSVQQMLDWYLWNMSRDFIVPAQDRDLFVAVLPSFGGSRSSSPAPPSRALREDS